MVHLYLKASRLLNVVELCFHVRSMHIYLYQRQSTRHWHNEKNAIVYINKQLQRFFVQERIGKGVPQRIMDYYSPKIQTMLI